jgi:hypothetical protein
VLRLRCTVGGKLPPVRVGALSEALQRAADGTSTPEDAPYLDWWDRMVAKFREEGLAFRRQIEADGRKVERRG